MWLDILRHGRRSSKDALLRILQVFEGTVLLCCSRSQLRLLFQIQSLVKRISGQYSYHYIRQSLGTSSDGCRELGSRVIADRQIALKCGRANTNLPSLLPPLSNNNVLKTTVSIFSTNDHILIIQPTALQTKPHRQPHLHLPHLLRPTRHSLQKSPLPNLSLFVEHKHNTQRTFPTVSRDSSSARRNVYTPLARTCAPPSTAPKSSSLTARSHMSFYRGRIARLRCLLPLGGEGKG